MQDAYRNTVGKDYTYCVPQDWAIQTVIVDDDTYVVPPVEEAYR